MQYFKAKKIITEDTTLSLVAPVDAQLIKYSDDESFEYYGANVNDVEGFLQSQSPEIEASELQYSDLQNILEGSKMMKDLDDIIEKKIAEEYSIGKELKMRDLLSTDPQRIAYEAFKASIKTTVRQMKIDMGLRIS